MDKKRRLIGKLLTLFTSVIAILLLLEGALRLKGFHTNLTKLVIKPHPLFSPDSLLGWKSAAGVYQIYINDTSIRFTATVDQNGNRIACKESDTSKYANLPVIQLYGCSCTFGFSVPDSLTQAYRLQKLLPNFKVENKGVPGYGLTQMFLLLQQSVAQGDTPKIAVFNYADFHDGRVPLSKLWSNVIWWCVTQGNESGYKDLSLPYYSFENNTPKLNRTPFNELTRFWPMAGKSVLVFGANIIYDLKCDERIEPELHKMAHNTALNMMKFCVSNHITPIFASIVNTRDNDQTLDIHQDLEKRGYLILNYGIDFGEEKYSCGRFDPGHPNALAHAVYTDKLYQLILNKKLDKQ